MKLTLQLAVVVLKAQTNFRDNLLKFSLNAPFPKQLFPRNLNSNGKQTGQDRRNRIASDIETNEAFPARETNPVDFDKLERYNPKRPKVDSPKWPGEINPGPSK